MIKTQNLSKTVTIADGELQILKGIELEINTSECVAIIGASGSGKSTLLGLLAGLDEASSGSVSIDGQDISTMSEDERAQIRSEKVGFVFQSFQLLPSLTALENVMLPLELSGTRDAESQARSFLERVGLGERLKHYPRILSGGEQQRVAIARAFASTPAILFADEPTGNLDTETGTHIIDLLFELNREQDTTLILVTHEQRLAQRCDRILELHAGELVRQSGALE
jgi:putative ABC transport system ATP-binding protein